MTFKAADVEEDQGQTLDASSSSGISFGLLNRDAPRAVSGISASSTTTEHTETLPRRFRSAFILYSAVRHKEVREQLGKAGKSERVRKQ